MLQCHFAISYCWNRALAHLVRHDDVSRQHHGPFCSDILMMSSSGLNGEYKLGESLTH